MSEILDLADARATFVAKPVPSFLFRLGTMLVLLSLVLMVVGPWIAPYDPNRPTFEISEPPPALAAISGLLWKSIIGAPHDPIHWFGTDSTGLDIFSRVIAAPRTDVAIAVGANIASLIIGSLLGLIAGVARPWFAGTVMRISDLIQAFPVFITGMILVTLRGPQ